MIKFSIPLAWTGNLHSIEVELKTCFRRERMLVILQVKRSFEKVRGGKTELRFIVNIFNNSKSSITMKSIILSTLFLLVGLLAKAQEPQYFFPDYECQYVLDSLNIPYVPIAQRNGTAPIYSDGAFPRSIKKHKKYFSNNEFEFCPNENTPAIKWVEFSKSLVFINEFETGVSDWFSVFDITVIGYSKINLSGGKYKSVQIVETRVDAQKQFSTIVLLEDLSGRVFFVNQMTYHISNYK